MRIIRLVATGAACGAAALALPALTSPVQALAAPKATTTFPEGFRPGWNLVINVTGCTRAPSSRGLRNEIFAEDPEFQRPEEGEGWMAIGGTRPDLQSGRTYRTEFRCDGRTFPLEITIPRSAGGGATASPSPGAGNGGGGDGGGAFTFGFDKVKLSTRTVVPGGKMGFTVTCPTTVTAESAAFAKPPTFTKKGQVSTGTATFGEKLPSIVKIKITCAGHGHVEYSTEPAKKALGEGGPKIPVGAPNTGGGAGQGPGALVYGGAAAALLAVAGGGALMLRRRAASAAETD
ncbi:hypothetical protein [Thermomonospora catenispora]|uniref:hypothetical protein n=1 Tax=Thermomonospora catenispora TaxID=2493090 RepID=UPI001124787D|nr:hypothetical protein [Thermomonospora catenispora]TNY36482.1 hypothetical protein EIO00_13160 [Thermomonospora catenispora]